MLFFFLLVNFAALRTNTRTGEGEERKKRTKEGGKVERSEAQGAVWGGIYSINTEATVNSNNKQASRLLGRSTALTNKKRGEGGGGIASHTFY